MAFDRSNAARTTIRLDPVGGVAGDMFLAAAVDAWPELEAPIVENFRRVGLPDSSSPRFFEDRRCNIAGRRFELSSGAGRPVPSGRVPEILERLTRSGLPKPVAKHACGVLEAIARAEATVHAASWTDVHLHEIADWDSIVDVVGAATVIDSLGPVRWLCGPLPLGRGEVDTAHGRIPVPSPATVILCSGAEFHDDGLDGERVTPTGAAILVHLGAFGTGDDRAGGRLIAGGVGLGRRELPGTPNLLRLLAFESREPVEADRVAVIGFEVDDQSPEDLALGLEALARRADVLSVTTGSVIGKKGRATQSVRVVTRADSREEVVVQCLAQTATLGLRWHFENRVKLPREHGVREVAGESLRFKRVRRPGGAITEKLEADDLGRRRLDFAARERLRRGAGAPVGEEDDAI